ncbi:MAG: prepilin-type N-terminal cleavage/methylation domain-containing protein [Candidatus Niyogibacteria bacterium]|nr:prepilin-type N-terminal cleavage/methylation domain-containing protein [Candidatus Niyogibacteria bacterium]
MPTKNFKLKTKNWESGFTLFEMIVSLSIFSTAMLILLSSLLSITSAQRKAVAISTTEDNLRFAVDTISKEIRTGYDYDCGNTGARSNCSGGNSVLAFNPGRTGITKAIYRLNNNSIEKSTNGGTSYLPLTGSDIVIKTLKFYVIGALTNDNLQPQVTLILQAEMGSGKEKSVFNLQTTIVQRQIDS